MTESNYTLSLHVEVDGFGDKRAQAESAKVAARALRNAFGDGVLVFVEEVDGMHAVDADAKRDVAAELADVRLPDFDAMRIDWSADNA